MKSARLGLALTAGLVAAIAGYFALVAPKTAGKVADPRQHIWQRRYRKGQREG
jgi:hypothetical protein